MPTESEPEPEEPQAEIEADIETETADAETQTEWSAESDVESSSPEDDVGMRKRRALEECLRVYNDGDLGACALSDEEVIELVRGKHIALYQLEKALDDAERGVGVRRKVLALQEPRLAQVLPQLPYKNYDYSKVSTVIIVVSFWHGGTIYNGSLD